MRLLIVSNTPWDDNNSFGNSFSNIFGGNENYEIANIYCQPGLPNNEIVSRHFQITEKSIVKSIFKKNFPSGKEIFETKDASSLNVNEKKLSKKLKILRWRIFFWMRDSIWMTKKWKSKELDSFIESFNPDLIFQPIYYSSYIDEIGIYASKKCGKPMVGYISDDCYTLRQFSLSPLFWIDRLWKRRYVKCAIDECKLLYVITERQKEEYNKIFGNKCKVLFKGGNFKATYSPQKVSTPINIVYTGNIGSGRWKILAKLADAIYNINKKEGKVTATLSIYTPTFITDRMRRELDIDDSSMLRNPVPASEVKELQKAADILVHVEPFALSERYLARLSFSTKIVDYLEAGRCILAIGWKETGGIEYLEKEDAAFIITDKKSIESKLSKLLKDPIQVEDYGKKGYECGYRNHQIDEIRNSLYMDLKSQMERCLFTQLQQS